MNAFEIVTHALASHPDVTEADAACSALAEIQKTVQKLADTIELMRGAIQKAPTVSKVKSFTDGVLYVNGTLQAQHFLPPAGTELIARPTF